MTTANQSIKLTQENPCAETSKAIEESPESEARPVASSTKPAAGDGMAAEAKASSKNRNGIERRPELSSKLSPELLRQVREKYQSVEQQFKASTGYGFDALTESEARYLVKHDDAQSVRDRIVAEGG